MSSQCVLPSNNTTEETFYRIFQKECTNVIQGIPLNYTAEGFDSLGRATICRILQKMIKDTGYIDPHDSEAIKIHWRKYHNFLQRVNLPYLGPVSQKPLETIPEETEENDDIPMDLNTMRKLSGGDTLFARDLYTDPSSCTKVIEDEIFEDFLVIRVFV